MRDEAARQSLCLFCGSAPGSRGSYADAAKRVGQAIAREGLGLVYGGGRVGLMGVAADAALAGGAPVVGIIPAALSQKEVAHVGLTQLIIVPGMHERKAAMASRSVGFLTLPGGLGTFEELFEIWTWAALGLHAKPLGLLNTDGYFNPLLHLLDHGVNEGFIRPVHRAMLLVSDDPDELVARLPRYVPPSPGPVWIDESQT